MVASIVDDRDHRDHRPVRVPQRGDALPRDAARARPGPGAPAARAARGLPDHDRAEAEPLEMVRPTLEAALRIRHDGRARRLAARRGRRPGRQAHVRRARRPPLQPARGRALEPAQRAASRRRPSTATTTPGSTPTATSYDFLLGVDPDHVPLPNFAERFLGYFRDPDVAFVVGPQVYGNYEGFVVRAAESQQFLFHSLIQRAGNRSRTPMLVGTNNAVRMSRAAPDRRAPGLDHRGHGHRPRDARHPQPGDRRGAGPPSTPPTCSPSARARVVHRLLHPAGPLVARHRRGARRRASGAWRPGSRPRALSTTCCSPATTRPRRSPGCSARSTRPLLRARRRRGGRAGAPVADALHRRRRAPDRPLLLQPPPQRQPARGGGLRRAGGHADLGAVGADLRGLAGRGGAAPHAPGS